MKGIPKKEKKIIKGYCFNKQLRDQPILWSEIQKHARTRDVYREESKTSSEDGSEKEEAEKNITINIAGHKKPEPKTDEVKVKYDPDKKRFYLVNPGEYGYEPPSIWNHEAKYSPRPYLPRPRAPTSEFRYPNRGFQRPSYQANNSRSNFSSFRGNNNRGQRMIFNSGGGGGYRPRFPTPPQNTFRRCFVCNRIGHIAINCDASERVCFVCGQTGHIAVQCTEKKGMKKEDHRGSKTSNQASTSRNGEEKSNW